MTELVWAEISLAALKNNISVLRQSCSNSKIMAVVKSDAYGHGLVKIAQAMSSTVDALAVARIDEAIELRQQGVEQEIIILSGVISVTDLNRCIAHQLHPVIHSQACIDALLSLDKSDKLTFWLKADTGMHRLGLNQQQLQNVHHHIKQCQGLNCLGLLTHLSDAEIVNGDKTQQQRQIFNHYAQQFDYQSLSMANSAAILFDSTLHFDWVRPGIMLYGINPSQQSNQYSNKLQPVMRLKSRVLSVIDVKAGAAIGYNERWRTEQATRIATIAIGYGDGYPRHAENGTPVYIDGCIYPLVGTVSMDMIAVNIGKADVCVGQEVELWGENISASTIAECANTIAYQLFCNITPRVNRIYSD